MRTTIISVMLLGLCSCAGNTTIPPDDHAELPPGDYEFSLTHDGLSRRYLVHVPPGTQGDLPVVLAFHGGGGNARQFRDENGINEVSDGGGFIAVHPDGAGPINNLFLTWNAGPTCCGWALENQSDDVGFIAAVIDELSERTRIDRTRIYATGHSNGAMMAYRLAAERADLVAAIVPVAGALTTNSFTPSERVAVLHIHSVDDPRALYDGGLGPPFPITGVRTEHRPVLAGLEAWASFNLCDSELSEVESQQGTGGNQGQSATRLEFDGCSLGGDVVHLRLTGVGHAWPGLR